MQLNLYTNIIYNSIMSLNFVCRMVSIEEILKCSFGLTQSEIKVLKFLSNTEEKFKIQKIQKSLKKDRSTIQRAVKSLSEKDLINRHQINLDKGGYYFVYSSIPKESIKERIYKNFDGFKNSVGSAIERW